MHIAKFHARSDISKHCHAVVSKGVLSLVALAVVACAATQLTNSWTSPDYKGPPLKKVLVMGVSEQPALRRTFEDEFVKDLKAVGVDAVPSYTLIPEGGKAEEARVNQVVKDAGADGVLVTRLVRVDVNTQVTPVYPSTMGMGYYGGYAGAYGGYYEPGMVTQTDTIVLETNLYGIDENHLLWSGTTETFAPTNLKQEMPGFAKLIIGTLQKHKLI
jgi:hypothetical protein